ncbi:hypothetical protein CK203_057399 [Vitis vinifera]|uniref:Uncharacterized protein n=1 Tax=Vitis vinifera TaxID=29760 RepID=A0A438FUI3_VITVI|nr:hypothetical protein CK203_057399 [Vitis vinifera]
MVTETPAVPVVVPAEVAPGETHPAVNVEALIRNKNPSAAYRGDLLMTHLASDLVSGLRGMANNTIFSDLLRTTDYMKDLRLSA